MTRDAAQLHAVTEATWPPAQSWRAGPWTLRQGAGGGKRVSAATAEDAFAEADIAEAERAMQGMGQPRLFMIRAGDTGLDAALAARGYALIDPVNAYVAPVAALDDRPIPRVTAFAIWEPLAIMREIWAEGGIGPRRLAVMERCDAPKTAIFGRVKDRPAAAGFAAIHDGIAMVHALHVRPALRRNGLAGWMMRLAARWAGRNGADRIAVLCTRDNEAANGLYVSMGFSLVGQYHYRIHPKDRTD